MPILPESTSGPGPQVVDGPQGVVDHHPPHHLAAPQHGFEQRALGTTSPLPKGLGVDAEHGVTLACQCLRIRWLLQGIAGLKYFVLAKDIVAPGCVVLEDGGEPPLAGLGPGEVGGHALDAIEVEHQLF